MIIEINVFLLPIPNQFSYRHHHHKTPTYNYVYHRPLAGLYILTSRITKLRIKIKQSKLISLFIDFKKIFILHIHYLLF